MMFQANTPNQLSLFLSFYRLKTNIGAIDANTVTKREKGVKDNKKHKIQLVEGSRAALKMTRIRLKKLQKAVLGYALL